MGGRTTERPTPPTFDHLPKKQPRRVRVPINFSEDAAEELAEAEAALVLAGEIDRPSALARLDRARKAAADATVVFVFQALGKPAYRELVQAHPPTADQMAEYDKAVAVEAAKPLGERSYVERPPFDLETFGPALIAAACVSHAMTAAEVEAEINSERWNITEVQRLWDGAFDAQTTTSRTTLGKGSGPTPS